MRGERTCIIDNKKYVYCPSCRGDNPTETWRFLYCSENCREIFNTLSAYAGKKLSANDAKAKLDQLNLPSLEQLQNGLRQNVQDIIANTTVIKSDEVTDNAKYYDVEPESVSELKTEEHEEESKRRFQRRKKKIVNED